MSLGTIEDLERLWNGKLTRDWYSILFRKFSPISGYEPDPKREEWRNSKDCLPCPFLTYRRIPKLIEPEFGIYTWLRCRLNLKELDLGDPSFCRFSEYRRILLRPFGPVT